MSVKLRVKRPDRILKKIVKALEEYEQAHPQAEIEAYRHNSVSVRVRVINEEFACKSRSEREDEVWSFLDKLPDEALSQISLLLLYTPDEAKNSFASAEFDDPIPSKL